MARLGGFAANAYFAGGIMLSDLLWLTVVGYLQHNLCVLSRYVIFLAEYGHVGCVSLA